MTRPARPHTRDWTRIEQLNSSKAELPCADGDADRELYLALIRDCDGRRAESIVLQSAVDPLIKARALYFRGHLDEAEREIARMRDQESDPSRLCESLLEQGRLANAHGDWAAARGFIHAALELDPAPVSRLTLYQMRAFANFECGELMEAMRDLERVDSMKSIFPNANSTIYADALRAKVLARGQGPEAAHRLLARLWAELSTQGRINADRALTLLRVETDVLRIERKMPLRHAVATWILAELMGDRLYAALALVDCWFASSSAGRGPLRARLESACQEFPRVRMLLEEIEGAGEHVSSSAAALRISRDLGSISAPHADEGHIDELLDCRALVLSGPRLAITLRPFVARELSGAERVLEAVRALASGPRSKADFFTELWGKRKYAPHLHDATISSLLYRMKARYGIAAAISDHSIGLRGVLVVP